MLPTWRNPLENVLFACLVVFHGFWRGTEVLEFRAALKPPGSRVLGSGGSGVKIDSDRAVGFPTCGNLPGNVLQETNAVSCVFGWVHMVLQIFKGVPLLRKFSIRA